MKSQLQKVTNYFKRIKNSQVKIFWLLIIVGFFLRTYKINNPIADWHSFRQADTASVSRIYSEKGINLLLPKYHDISRIQSGIFNPNGYRMVEFPIYNLFHALLFKYIDFFTIEVWGRLLSIFSALISAYYIYKIGGRLISGWGGLLASAFFLLNPYNIYFTRVILPEPLAVTFAVSSLWYFIKYFDDEETYQLIIGSILISLSILIKPYTVFYLVPVIGLALEHYNFKKIIHIKKFWISALIILLPFILWRFWIRQFPEGIPFWKWTFNGDGIRFKPAFWYWIFGERLTKLILGYLGIIPFFAGVAALTKKNKFIALFILGMFLFVSTIATANVRHDYYQSITIPAISLVFSLGLIKLWNTKEFNVVLMRSILVFSILLMLMNGASQAKEYYNINHPEIIAAGKAVQRLTPKDSLIIAAYFGDTAFLYQTDRSGWPNVELPIDELIEEGAKYYTSVDLGSAQTKEFMTKFKTLELTPTYVVLDLQQRI